MSKLTLPTLLAISDNSSIRHWIKKHLEHRFFIVEADREFTALNLVRSNALDLIILDSQITGADPFELCKKLRSLNAVTPILYITGRLKKSYLDAALEAGVTDFLNDALDTDELEIRIAVATKAAAARDKTTEFATLIKPPRPETPRSIASSRLIFSEQAMKLLGKTPAALLVIRLDQYEQLPHPNEWLAQVSQRLTEYLDKEDLLLPSSEGRVLVLLPRVGLDAAKRRAERIRKAIDLTPFVSHEKSLHLTISIAVGLCDANIEQSERLASSAGKALKANNSITEISNP